MTVKLSDSQRDRAARIVALFSVLIHAREISNFQEAANAHDELESLGVKVRFCRQKEEGVDHA